MSVTKSQVTAVNGSLTQTQMETNAQYITQVLRGWGWSDQAIAATLANMQAESGINPGVYESHDSSSTTNGYGLVQWTPNTKYKTWADANGYTYSDVDAQLQRIQYEIENGLQWIQTDAYPLTFAEYTVSTLDVTYLCYAFMHNYERPASLDQPHRMTYAETWLDFIGGAGGGTITPTPSPSVKVKPLPLIYRYIVTRRRF